MSAAIPFGRQEGLLKQSKPTTDMDEVDVVVPRSR